MILRMTMLAAAAVLLQALPAAAEVRLPAIFGDHMVVQRELPVPVWGWDAPGAKVSVTLNDRSAAATADNAGRWRVKLRPLDAGTGLTMTIKGSTVVELQDVAVGEVWVCSGQSNMEWPVSASWNADLALASADRPDIRLISVPNAGSQTPTDDFPGRWERCTPPAAKQFSAVGYHFGKRLADTLGVPVGLIDNAWGGSAAEAWTPRERLKSAEFFNDTMASYVRREAAASEADERAAYEEKLERWRRARDRAIERGDRPSERPKARGLLLGNHRPSNLFNGRVAPIAGYAIRGAIWYQGESNSGRAAEYRDLFPLMIQAWRDEWGQGDFPFYWVQLADFKPQVDGPQESAWAELREAQTLTLDRLPYTGEAVIIDLGEAADIHPRNKEEVANRLARWALANDYGLPLAHASPRFDSLRIEAGKAIVTLKDVSQKLRTVDAKALQGFTLAGEDRVWRIAKAKILDKQTVEVWNPKVENPVAVRYAWADNPVCNLYDATGLPVTPFRSDDWPGVTD